MSIVVQVYLTVITSFLSALLIIITSVVIIADLMMLNFHVLVVAVVQPIFGLGQKYLKSRQQMIVND